MFCTKECECVYCQMDNAVEEAKKDISSGEDVVILEEEDVHG